MFTLTNEQAEAILRDGGQLQWKRPDVKGGWWHDSHGIFSLMPSEGREWWTVSAGKEMHTSTGTLKSAKGIAQSMVDQFLNAELGRKYDAFNSLYDVFHRNGKEHAVGTYRHDGQPAFCVHVIRYARGAYGVEIRRDLRPIYRDIAEDVAVVALQLQRELGAFFSSRMQWSIGD